MSMTKTQVGTRVGAILYADTQKVGLLGYGVYEGDFVPPVEANEMLSTLDITNPRIKLDDGRTVWGCQCWWGPEDKIKANIEGREVVIISDHL